MYDVALIGAGNMGGAMLRGWLGSGVLEKEEVIVSDVDGERIAQVSSQYGVDVVSDNARAASDAQTVVMAVKPKDSRVVLGELSEVMGPDDVLVSIVAGLPIDVIRRHLGKDSTVVRVMPNMGARVGASMTTFCVDEGRGSWDRQKVLDLLGAVGEVEEVREDLKDLVTAISGSGPAYFFLMVELLQEVGEQEGLPAAVATKLARETLWGAAKVLKETGLEAGGLREAVSSPGGTTLAALEVLLDEGFESAIRHAVEAARERASEISSSHD